MEDFLSQWEDTLSRNPHAIWEDTLIFRASRFLPQCTTATTTSFVPKDIDALDVSSLEKANATATSLTPPVCAVSLLAGSNFTNSFSIPARPDGVDDLISRQSAHVTNLCSSPTVCALTPVTLSLMLYHCRLPPKIDICRVIEGESPTKSKAKPS